MSFFLVKDPTEISTYIYTIYIYDECHNIKMQTRFS